MKSFYLKWGLSLCGVLLIVSVYYHHQYGTAVGLVTENTKVDNNRNAPEVFYRHIPIENNVFYNLRTLRLADNSNQYDEANLLDAMQRNCTFSSTLNSSNWVRLPDGRVESIDKYKSRKKSEFMKLKANPTKKSEVRPTVKAFDQNAPANPTGRVKDPKEEINFEANFAEVARERERCNKLGNDNILNIPEVQEEMKQTEYKIPNLVHFIWFSCNPFRIDHYMAVMGALRYQRPRLVLFHTDCEPHGDYWEALKRIAGNKLRVVKRSPPEKIWGLDIKVVEHHADVVRLELMLEVGGMYMDTDSIILNNLDKFRKEDIVLGQETTDAVANGIILSSRNSWFLHRWFWEYKYFRDDIWGHNSVLVPWGIWKYFPDTIHIESNTFCRPNWGELNLLYYDLMDWSKSYVMHLYSRFMASYDGTRERPLKELAVLNTTFGEVARHVIFGDKEVRDITNWIVTCDVKEILYSARPWHH